MEFRPHSLKLLILSEIRNKLRELLFDVIQREDDYIEVSQLTENSILVADLLLQNHQASPQTNFGRIRDQPGYPAPDARLICLSRLYIIAFASISSKRNRGSFVRKNFYLKVKVIQIPITKADLVLRIFEAIPGTLKRFELFRCPKLCE